MSVASDPVQADTFSFHPTMAAFLRFVVQFVVGMGASGLVAIVVRHGGDVARIRYFWPAVAVIAAMPVVLGPVMHAFFVLWTVTLTSSGIRGRGWGERVEIAWDDVGTARFMDGILPTLTVSSSDGTRTLYAYAGGLPRSDLETQLARFAGSGHVATRAVASPVET